MALAQSQYAHGDIEARWTRRRQPFGKASPSSRHGSGATSDFQRAIAPQAANTVVQSFNDYARIALADPDDE